MSRAYSRRITPIIERVMRKVRRLEDGCWIWQGCTHDGYGMIGVSRPSKGGKHMERTHRVTYEHAYGPIPEGLQLDHLCRVRACVRPSHLRAVTLQENMLAPGSRALPKINGEKTHCINGHEFTESNTYRIVVNVDGRTRRSCKACILGRRRASLTSHE